MKKILFLLVIPLLLVSCEDNIISGKDPDVLDFLSLYGKSKKEILEKTQLYYINTDYDRDFGNLRWMIQSNDKTPTITIGEYEYFVMLGFVHDECYSVILTNAESDYDGAAFYTISKKYGDAVGSGSRFMWKLRDGSFIGYICEGELIITRTLSPNSYKAPER